LDIKVEGQEANLLIF